MFLHCVSVAEDPRFIGILVLEVNVSQIAGASSSSREVIPARDALAFWLKKNGNNASAFVADLPDADPEDESRVRFERFGNDGDRNEVVFYEIKGGGHTRPGGMQYLPKSIVGPVCRDIDGNRVIWNFFREHQL